MASFDIKSPNYNGLEYLRDYHTFGRRKGAVDTALEHAYVSKLHAVIEWQEPNWLLKDVSKNGLKLNNKTIPAQKSITLSVGDVIDFAGVGEVSLKINNLDAPFPMLVNTALPSKTIEITGGILLPNEDTPELALYQCSDRGQWFADSVERGIETGPYEHGDQIKLSGTNWKFILAAENDVTTELDTTQTLLDDVVFLFDLSQHEESTNLAVMENGVRIDLGERSHHYLLMHLLRHRAKQGSGTGWLDSQLLLKELDLDETQMNIQIFQARKQIADALPNVPGHSKLIERRRGSLRTSIRNFKIYKEGSREI